MQLRMQGLNLQDYQKYTGTDGVDRIATDILASRISIIDDPEPMQYEM